ncbi:MAG: hypothetical protein P4L55_03830 [Syntrophobacteraceae bacterium]|nr:hypothetical protein [Syntrophobacteraceae bacterium]
MTRFKLLVVAVLVGFVAIAHAGFNEGKAAFDIGDYATAYKEFKPLAEQGNVSAQSFIASIYYSGLGVLQDLAEAVHDGRSIPGNWIIGKPLFCARP